MEKRNDIIRIAVTGPESTGKTTLAKALAAHFGTIYVPEYAREYLDKNGKNYSYNDLEKIAKGQLAMENQMSEVSKKLLIADTEMLVIKIWSIYQYGKCSPWITETIKTHYYDLYLLCNIDLPWEYDPLRENPLPEERQAIFKLYQTELDNYKFPYIIVSGTGNTRINKVIQYITEKFGFH